MRRAIAADAKRLERVAKHLDRELARVGETVTALRARVRATTRARAAWVDALEGTLERLAALHTPSANMGYQGAMKAFERELLRAWIAACGGDLTRARRSLKMSDSTFLRRRKGLGVDVASTQTVPRERKRRAKHS